MEDFTALLDSGVVNERTRAVLRARLTKPPVTEPRFFNAAQFATLHAVCARLIPQPPGDAVDLPGLLDEKMKTGGGKGWRYDKMPCDARTISRGLDGVEETAERLTGKAFSAIPGSLQDDVLRMIQDGSARGNIWEVLSPVRFFEELLTALVELYYSHPFGKAQIGDVSFADAHGWVRIGLHQQAASQPAEAELQRS